MGLIATLKRWRYVYGWRIRYWWHDTPGGLHARIMLAVLASLAVIGQTIAVVVKMMQPVQPGQPRESIVWFIVWAIVALLAAVVAYAMAPGVKPPTATQADTPTTDDGQSVKHHFGTCWVDDSFLLAWKITGTSPIKTKGGKK